MIGFVIAVALLAYFVFDLYKKAYTRPDNFPPGPPTLPVYGAYWIILANGYNDLATSLSRLGEKYKTNILGMYLGPLKAIIINDPQLIREMLFLTEFDGRVDTLLTRLRSYWKQLGLFFTDGYFWLSQRRFSFRYLRDNGFGRRDEAIESVIAAEVKEMIDMRINGPKYPAEKKVVNGELIHLPYYFTVPLLNGLMHVFSRMTLARFEYRQLWDLTENSLLFVRSTDDLGRALVLTPWLKDIFPNWSGYNGLKKGTDHIKDFFKKIIEEAMASYDDDSPQDRHFIDTYIRQMKEELKGSSRTTFSVDQLILTCTDLAFPAAAGATTLLAMLVEHILLQPYIQEKVHEEIDRVVGRDRPPTLDDRPNLPFTEACIREALRFESIVPLGVPHRTTADTMLGGYDIPANTLVAANYVKLHKNKAIWGDPYNFRPGRFIVNGKIDLAFDKALPFGAGRRICPGETFARHAMFQVFSGFMQAFHVTAPDRHPLKKPSQRIQGIITTIPECWIKVMPRS